MQTSTFTPPPGNRFGPALAASPGTDPTPTATGALPASPQLAAGILFLILELFVLQTRFFDFVLSGFRIPMLVFILLTVSLLAALGSQTWNFSKRTTVLMLLQLGWMAFATVFSTWRSNSVAVLTAYLYLSIVGVAIIVLIDTPRRLIRILTLFGVFSAIPAFMGFVWGRSDLPRLQLLMGTYSDPNIYALSIVAGIPVVYWMMNSSNVLMRLTALTMSLAMYWIVLKTGSRGAFISLTIVFLFVLYHASLLRKMLMVAGVIIGIFIASITLSTYSKNRLFTLFKSDLNQEELQSMSEMERNAVSGDVGSSESRWQLLLDSLELTGKHPLVGVGPGNFGDARWQMHLARIGRNIAAQTTHNTYTQFSSEAGIIGLLIFLAQIIDAFGNLKAIRKWKSADGYRPAPTYQAAAHYLRLSLISLCVGMAFLSLAYSGPFCIIVGLTLALRNTVEKEWMRYRVAQQETNPMVLAVPAGSVARA